MAFPGVSTYFWPLEAETKVKESKRKASKALVREIEASEELSKEDDQQFSKWLRCEENASKTVVMSERQASEKVKVAKSKMELAQVEKEALEKTVAEKEKAEKSAYEEAAAEMAKALAFGSEREKLQKKRTSKKKEEEERVG